MLLQRLYPSGQSSSVRSLSAVLGLVFLCRVYQGVGVGWRHNKAPKRRRDTLLHPFPLIVVKDKCEAGCRCSPNPRAVKRSWEFPSTGEGRGLLVRSCVGQSRIGTGEPTSLALRMEEASPGLERWLHTMLKCWSHKHQDLSSIPHEETEHTLAVPALWRQRHSGSLGLLASQP